MQLAEVSVATTDFDSLIAPHKPRFQMRRGTLADLEPLEVFVARHMAGPLAPRSVVERVIANNPNSLMVISSGNQLVGVWAMLMLSARGLEALMAGEFSYLYPPNQHLSSAAAMPAAIYVWLLVCPGLASEGIHYAAEFLRQPLYRTANLYSCPSTPTGVKINVRRGFKPIGDPRLRLMRYLRQANRTSELIQAA